MKQSFLCHSWFSGLLCRLFLLMWVMLWGFSSSSWANDTAVEKGQLLDRIAVQVNDDILLWSDVQAQSLAIIRQLQQQGRSTPDLTVLRQQVANLLINQLLVKQRAKDLGIRISDEDLNANLTRLANQNGMDLLQFQQRLNQQQANGFTLLRNQVAQQMTLEALRVRDIYQRIRITEAEIDQTLEMAKAQGVQWQYELQQILFAFPLNATEAQRDQIQQQANQVRQRLLDGEDFHQLAIRYSKGPKALDGGYLGWYNADRLPTFFSAPVKKMQLGQLSQLILSPAGYHQLKLIGKRKAEANDRELNRDTVRQQLLEQKSSYEQDVWLLRLRDEAYIQYLMPELQQDT